MPRIFISYRRDDSAAHAGRLYDRLEGHFGKEDVFMDIDTIKPGLNFVEVVEQALSDCDGLIAVIGREWLRASDPAGSGRRRIDDPADMVRLEIATALGRNIPVIPVLVQGAQMPRAVDLPEDLKELAHRNALEVSDNRFRTDVDQLIEALGTPTTERPADSVFVEQARLSGRRFAGPVRLAVILSAVALGVGALFLSGVIPAESQTSSIPEPQTFAPLRTVSIPVAPGQSTRLVSPEGDVFVDISAGSVNTLVRLWYGVLPLEAIPPTPPGFRYSGKVFDLSVTGEESRLPDTFSFVKPVDIAVRLTEEDASTAGGVESNVVIQRYDPGEHLWTPLETTVDWTASIARVQVRRFSNFALTIKEP